MEAVLQKLAEQCSAFVRERYGFVIPWEAIIQLVEWIIEECFPTPEGFVESCRCPTWFQAMVLRRRAIQTLRGRFHGLELRRAANAVTDGIFETGAIATDEELQGVYNEVSGGAA